MDSETSAASEHEDDSATRVSADDFVERVFAKSNEYLRDRYSNIVDAPRFHTKIAGVSFEGRQDTIAGLRAGAALNLRREPENPHDANAIAVHYGNLQLGFLNRQLAAHLAPVIDAGIKYTAHIASLTGSGEGRHRGVNIFLEREATAAVRRRAGDATRATKTDDAQVEERVREALIGDAQPHAPQRAILERIDAGKNALAIFGTGRGKSFCFQYAAALRALRQAQGSPGEGKTLVIYPLRALANDQFEALLRRLEPLGVRCFRANGSIDADEREDLFTALRDGEWDIVLATPEFLEFHRDALQGPSLPSFVVVDEAHHLAESRHRPAYARLGETIASFGRPQVLALTATAEDEPFKRIVEDLGISSWVIDPTVRDNLEVVDARDTGNKLRYLVDLFAQSPPGARKGIVYCNSRPKVTEIAQRLRRELGDVVMFYHGGMPNAERLEIEQRFRDGSLEVIVATTAFGEGIDLPDVRNVVLFHLNFSAGEFNQQAGRAGRDGAPAQIHLLYGQRDRPINEYLIDCDYPPLERLREIYRGMKAMASPGSAIVRADSAAIAGTLDLRGVEAKTVRAALHIFADSGLVELGDDDEGSYVRFLPVSGRVEMERNERYAEGQATRLAFADFSKLALSAPAESLERLINRPIYPSRVELCR
ncbi:MAG: DEAD/DEAH box helicase [Candidatus Eremiobacteraeota bacterium]|nr:DEAD/DEAH box helicase [Candidatus Eremiobacteraeota bacterium]